MYAQPSRHIKRLKNSVECAKLKMAFFSIPVFCGFCFLKIGDWVSVCPKYQVENFMMIIFWDFFCYFWRFSIGIAQFLSQFEI